LKSRRLLFVIISIAAVIPVLILIQMFLMSVKWDCYIWLPSYFSRILSESSAASNLPFQMFVLMVDHYEPGSGHSAVEKNRNWLANYRSFVKKHSDPDGRSPQHTWFFPIDQYQDQCLTDLSAAVAEGLGEIEVHWHHKGLDEVSYESRLSEALARFSMHGAVVDENGKISFGYIAGNWALDNSQCPVRCGPANELEILSRNGCYADFTFSTIGTTSQPKMVNSIYYAKDTGAPKSYDTGVPVAVGRTPLGHLMIFQGPMGFSRWFPSLYLEYGAFEIDPLPTPSRLPGLIRHSTYVEGKPEWRFLKVYTHGQQSSEAWFGGAMDETLTALEKGVEGFNYKLHYLTAREAYNLVKAAEAGLTGDPRQYYDWLIKSPKNRIALSGE